MDMLLTLSSLSISSLRKLDEEAYKFYDRKHDLYEAALYEVSSHVVDFNARNKSLTAKLLQQGYRYHKL